MAAKVKKVEGKDRGNVLIYALSTCIWCRKTKNLLKDLNIAYSYIDVDLLEEEERKKVLKDLKKFNPAKGFPTIVINNKDAVIGFDENKIRDYFEE